MNKSTSIYLDLVRFWAALLVFLHHFAYPRITGDAYLALGAFGEDAVMIFFVLSGYVIAYVVAEKEDTAANYFTSRLARLYSVVVPALVLTVLLDTIGQRANPALYDGWWYQNSHPWIRTLISVTFTNQLWFFDIRYFSNGPYWSISYEFWYYVLFGIALFSHGAARWTLLLLCALVMGPSLLLLAPVWFLGVWVYRLNLRLSLSRFAGWLLFVGPVLAYAVYRYHDLGQQLTAMSDTVISPLINPLNLHKSRFFLHDYVVGLLVAMHFVGANTLAQSRSLSFMTLEQPIRYAAGYTFTLYLLHYPLLHCLTALSSWNVQDLPHHILLVGTSALVIWLVGNVTEKKKRWWKHLILRLWEIARLRIARS